MSNLAKLKKKAAEYEQNRQFDKALSVYEDVLRAQSGSEDADIALYNRVGDLQARQGRSADALRSYEQAADLYADRGFLNNAIALYNKVLRQEPAHAEVQFKLGRLSASKGFRSDARRHFGAYVTQMQRVGRVEEALSALRDCSQSDTDAEETRLVLADLLCELGRTAEAVDELRQVLAHYERQQRRTDAQAVVERIRTLDPNFTGDDAGDTAGRSADGDVELGDFQATPTPRADLGGRGAAMPPDLGGLVLFSPSEDAYDAGARPPTSVEPLDLMDVRADDAPAAVSLEAGRIAEATAADALGAELTAPADESMLGGAVVDFGNADAAPLAGLETGGGLADAMPGADERVHMPQDLIRGAEFLDTEQAVEAATVPGLMLVEPAEPVEPPPVIESLVEPEFDDAFAAPVGSADSAPEEGAAALELVVFSPEGEEAGTPAAPAAPAAAGESEGWMSTDEGTDDPGATGPTLTLVGMDPDDHAQVEAAGQALDFVLPDAEPVREEAAAPVEAAVESSRSARAASDAPGASTGDDLLSLAQELDAGPAKPWTAPAPMEESFNLGDWLRADEGPRTTRMVTEERAPSGDEQADFNDMLRKFKQGVAENVSSEEYDAHYDLGIAFREMGLLDEAIAAFQKALRGPDNRPRIYEALGQCFLDKGQHSIASSVLQRAINEPGLDDQQLVGVLYLLGRASEALHQKSDALRYYQRVFAVDIEFSDVAERIGLVEQVSQ